MIKHSFITADFVLLESGLSKNTFLKIDKNGKILDITDSTPNEKFKKYDGIISPGFINAHCHLELSHLENKIPQKTGMAEFIRNIQSQREEPDDFVKNSMETAVKKIFESGTQLVLDICNDENLTKAKNSITSIKFHNFLELFSLNPESAENIFQKAKKLKTELQNSSITAHAPYSLSTKLFELIFSEKDTEFLSIHFLESTQERLFLENNKGELYELFSSFGIDQSYFPKPDTNFVEHFIEKIPKNSKILFVHNTELKEQELHRISEKLPQTYFCLCPNSNLFIHNKLPKFGIFREYKEKICIGTDSLASNTSLDLLEEIKTIQQNSNIFTLEELLFALTKNPAVYLNQKEAFGKFTKGKYCGIVWIKNVDLDNIKLTKNSKSERIY